MSSLNTKKEVMRNIHLSKEEFDNLPDVAKKAITASGIPLSLSATADKTLSIQSASADTESQKLAGVLGTYRWDWGDKNGQWILRFNWGVVTPRTAVFVAIGEGAAGGPTAGKFIGGARYTLFNVAPRNGGVDIWIDINFDRPIRIYVDYMVVSIDRFGPPA